MFKQIFISITLLFSFMSFSFQSNAQAPVALQKDMASVISAFEKLDPQPLQFLTPAEARLQPTIADAVRVLLGQQKRVPSNMDIIHVYNITIPGPGGPMNARVYDPQVGKAMPLTLYFHGGGWVIADIDTYQGSAYALAKKSGSIVVSVEYRKAPENKFPAAHEDAYAAYKWILANSAQLGSNGKKVAVVGESAGGNLAINVAIRARDEKIQAPVHVVAIYPVAGGDMTTQSYMDNETTVPLNSPMVAWFFKQYLNNDSELQDPRINLVAANLAGLPSTNIITADADPLRSEGQALALKLQQQGVLGDSRFYAGTTHEFFGTGDLVKQARAAQDFVGQELKKSFGDSVLNEE